MSDKTRGIYFSIATAVISGISIFVNKFAVDAVRPPLFFISVKNLAVALLLICLVLATGKLSSLIKLSRRELKYLILIGIIGGALPFYLYFTGLSQISAINAALIHKSLVIWVALLALPFLKEKLSKLQATALLLIFAGNLVIGGFKGFQFSRGEFYILVATLLWAAENILAKKILESVDSTVVALFRMGFGSIILVTATLFTTKSTSSVGNLTQLQIFWIGLTVLTLFGYVFTWYKALSLAPAVTVATVIASSTLITNLLSAIFITHSWNMLLTFQTLFITTGVSLVMYTNKRNSKIENLNTI